MAKEIRSFEDLDVWQRGIDLTLRIYAVVARLPSTEKYELSSQMRRSAVSIPSNVAEGHARKLPKPYVNHVYIALGSHAELVTDLIVCSRLGFITEEQLQAERRETDRVGQMLHGLARALEKRIETQRARVVGGLAAFVTFVWGLL